MFFLPYHLVELPAVTQATSEIVDKFSNRLSEMGNRLTRLGNAFGDLGAGTKDYFEKNPQCNCLRQTFDTRLVAIRLKDSLGKARAGISQEEGDKIESILREISEIKKVFEDVNNKGGEIVQQVCPVCKKQKEATFYFYGGFVKPSFGALNGLMKKPDVPHLVYFLTETLRTMIARLDLSGEIASRE